MERLRIQPFFSNCNTRAHMQECRHGLVEHVSTSTRPPLGSIRRPCRWAPATDRPLPSSTPSQRPFCVTQICIYLPIGLTSVTRQQPRARSECAVDRVVLNHQRSASDETPCRSHETRLTLQLHFERFI